MPHTRTQLIYAIIHADICGYGNTSLQGKLATIHLNLASERGYKLACVTFNEKNVTEDSDNQRIMLQMILEMIDANKDKKFVFITSGVSAISKDKDFASNYLKELNKRGVSVEITDIDITTI